MLRGKNEHGPREYVAPPRQSLVPTSGGGIVALIGMAILWVIGGTAIYQLKQDEWQNEQRAKIVRPAESPESSVSLSLRRGTNYFQAVADNYNLWGIDPKEAGPQWVFWSYAAGTNYFEGRGFIPRKVLEEQFYSTLDEIIREAFLRVGQGTNSLGVDKTGLVPQISAEVVVRKEGIYSFGFVDYNPSGHNDPGLIEYFNKNGTHSLYRSGPIPRDIFTNDIAGIRGATISVIKAAGHVE
jgi:hypothetical protein